MCMLDYDPTCTSRSLYPLTQVERSRCTMVIWRTRGHVTPEGVPPVVPAGAGRGLRFLRSDCMTLTPCLFSLPVPACPPPPPHTVMTSSQSPAWGEGLPAERRSA